MIKSNNFFQAKPNFQQKTRKEYLLIGYWITLEMALL